MAVNEMVYEGRSYRAAPLVLPRQGSLGTVSRWIEVPPCNDTFTPGQPRPSPSPPTPVRFDFPLARLTGIAPKIAVADANRQAMIWLASSCSAPAPMDAAVSCLGLSETAAFRAASRADVPPQAISAAGTMPLVVASSTSCPAAAAACRGNRGAIHHFPRLQTRQGEELAIRFDLPLDSVQISYGQVHEPLHIFPSGTKWDLHWRVPASGHYTVKLSVAQSTPSLRRHSDYLISLNARPSPARTVTAPRR
jgi:hypothetical protein